MTKSPEKKREPGKKTKAPSEGTPTKPTKSPVHGKKRDPGKKTKKPSEGTPTKPTKAPTVGKKREPTKPTKLPTKKTPTKPTKMPTKKTPTKPTKMPTKDTPDKKTKPPTIGTGKSKKKDTGKKSKRPKTGGANGSKCAGLEGLTVKTIEIGFMYQVDVGDKKIKKEEDVMKLLQDIEEKMVDSIGSDLIDCRRKRLLGASDKKRTLENTEPSLLLDLKPTSKTEIKGEF